MNLFSHVLLIDDDEDDREIFSSAIARVGAVKKFTECSCPVAALKSLEQRELKPDIIFLDLNMPKMNGHEFLTRIKSNAELSKIPVVIFSTSGNSRNIKASMDLGASDYITKPYRFDALVEILNRLFA